VTNIIFIFETSPNTKPKEKKVGGHVPRVPHLIAPMLLFCDQYLIELLSQQFRSHKNSCYKR